MDDQERLVAALEGRYRIEREIGSGGMATVYLAKDLKHDRKVAVKVLNPDLAQTLGADRFLREIKTSANLTHPHILPLHDSGEADGFLFYVMPYVKGESLRTRLTKERQLPVEDAIQITREIADALAYAHREGVIHRDVKPANIMLDEGHAMVADFGVAHAVAEAKDDRITRTGTSLGTPAYMSPEQAMGEQDLDGRSDQYALGCVLYEMLAGHPPFTGAQVEAVVRQHLTEEPPSVTQARPSVADEIVKVINRALSKSPADRFKTTGEMAAALALTTLPIQRGSIPLSKPLRSRFGVAATSVVVLSVVAVGVFFLARDPGPPPAPVIGHTTRLTQDPGLELDPASSPNGELVAYVASQAGISTVFVQQVSGGRPLPVLEDFPGAAQSPRWSPDGSKILFASGNTVYVVPALGGTPRPVVTAEGEGAVRSAVWSPDGQQIAFSDGRAIHLASSDGLTTERLVDHNGVTYISWSPDGTRLAFATGDGGYTLGIDVMGLGNLWIVSIREKEAELVLGGGTLNESPVWTPDGNGLVFVSNRGGGRDIFLLPLDDLASDDREPIRITTGQNAHTVSISADGSRLAYSQLTNESNIYSAAVPSGRPASVGRLEPVTRGAQIIEKFSISPDGQWVTFDSDRNGNFDIYKMRPDGGDPIPLTLDPSDDFSPDWSPDGRQIVFHSTRNGTRDLFSIPADGGGAQQLTHDSLQDRMAKWGPDGNRIVFWRTGAGTAELYLLLRESPDKPWAPPRLVSLAGVGGMSGGMSDIEWSPEGSSFAVSWADGIYFVDPDRDPPSIRTIRLGFQPGLLGWPKEGDGLWIKTPTEGDEFAVWAVDEKGGRSQIATVPVPPGSRILGWDAAAERVYFSILTPESNIWIADLAWPH